MAKDRITSGESEGIFNEFIRERIEDKIEDILNEGDYEENMSDVVIEVDDIHPPTFVYDDPKNGGGRGGRPGMGGDKLKFVFPFEKFMHLIAKQLELPDLTKEGQGKIKEISHEFKTFGPVGIVLDKKRTFKRAIKGSIATGLYSPKDEEYEIQIRKKDRRFHVPKRVEKPRYKAVCFYMGDISFSTYGERLALEKKLVSFITNWLNYNYGRNNVDHRFFVHDWDAYEVSRDEFFKCDVAGGTRASVAFDLVNTVAREEYSPDVTNYYAFYFGDGELFGNDADDIFKIISEDMESIFNRIGIIEIIPSSFSSLLKALRKNSFKRVKTAKIKDRKEMVDTIKTIFR